MRLKSVNFKQTQPLGLHPNEGISTLLLPSKLMTSIYLIFSFFSPLLLFLCLYCYKFVVKKTLLHFPPHFFPPKTRNSRLPSSLARFSQVFLRIFSPLHLQKNRLNSSLALKTHKHSNHSFSGTFFSFIDIL